MPMTAEQASSFWFLTENQDMEALNRFFHQAQIKTPEAQRLKTDWIQWWESLGFWEKNTGEETYDEARNRYHAFVKANTITPEELSQVNQVISGGVTTEEMSGDTRRSDTSGDFILPESPLIPTWVKGATIVGLLGVVAYGALKVAKQFTPARFL